MSNGGLTSPGLVNINSDNDAGRTQIDHRVDAFFASSSKDDLRILNYLGSKLRLLNPIRQAVAEVVPRGARVCDLFAGSGVVSLGLSTAWRVVSVDIQEYSRVICSGILNRPVDAKPLGQAILLAASTGHLRKSLRLALRDLLALEQRYLQKARSRDVIGLCDLIEQAPLLAVNEDPSPLVAENSEAYRTIWAASNRLALMGLQSGPESVITRYYGGVYFSWEQAIDLDALLHVIHNTDPSIRDFFLAAVLSVASDIVNTVGKHFAQPVKLRDAKGQPKYHLIRQTIRDRSVDVFDLYASKIEQFANLPRSSGGHVAIRGDYRDILWDTNVQFDAIYADPPYTRDHYSRFYHVLETMSLYDEPTVSRTMIRASGKPRLSQGLYRSDRHQSPFCIKSQAPGAFEELFRATVMRQVPLVLSYSPYNAKAGNRPRLLTIDELVNIARGHFRTVKYRPVEGVQHNKLNVTARNVDVNYDAEVLLTCLP